MQNSNDDQSRTLVRPRAGIAEDMTEDDNSRGFERDETDTNFWRIVTKLADDACVLCGWWTCRCGGVAPAPKNGAEQ